MKERFEKSGLTLERLFKSFDKDKEGAIDLEEFRTMLTSLGVVFTKEEVDQVFLMVDADGGGEIELSEFTAWYNGQVRAPATERDVLSVRCEFGLNIWWL